MTPKEIGRAAGRIFQGFIPPHWAIRVQEDQEDYGIDYEIELTTADDQATGFIFKVQQKGATSADRNVAGDAVSFGGIPVEKARYYLEQIGIPVVFVVVDVTAKAAYWTVLQGNPQIEAAYRKAVAGKQDTFTIHIPTANDLPKTAELMLDSVTRCLDWLTLRSIKRASSTRLLEAAARGLNLDEVTDAIGRHRDFLRAEQIEALLRGGAYTEAWNRSVQIFQSPSESIASRFAAGMHILRIAGGNAARQTDDPRALEELLTTRLSVSAGLVKIVRPHAAPRPLRLYSRFLFRTARLRVVAENDWALYQSLKIQEETGDAFTRHMTHGSRLVNAARVVRELRAAQLDIVRLIRASCVGLLAGSWVQIVTDVTPFLLRLKHEGITEAVVDLVGWLDQLGKVCINIAKQRRDWDSMILCALTQIGLSLTNSAEQSTPRIEYARECINSIPDASVRDAALKYLEEYVGDMQRLNRDLTIQEEIQVIRQMARSLGIDLDNPNDPLSPIVNVGLQDLNPERVLKHCKHLFVSLGYSGIPAQMLGLPTAGSKWLHCTKHGYAIMGQSLDDTYGTFRERYCDRCRDCDPHPIEWKWDRKWQEQQNKLNVRFAERVRNV